MSVAATLTQRQYTGTGTSAQFSFPNKIFSAGDLVITIYDTLGNAYPFVNFANATLGWTYSVQNVDVDTGCIVVLSNVLTSGWVLDIRSLIPELQSTSIKNQGQFLPELHEEAFDRATRMIQDLLRLTYTYGIHASDNEVTPWPALPGPTTRRGLTLMFDGTTGLPTLGFPTAQNVTQGLIAPLLNPQTAAELAASITPVNFVFLPGNVLRYGTNTTPGTTDMTAAIQAALNQAAQPTGVAAYLPAGTYFCSAQLTVGSNVLLHGDGSSSVITYTNPNISYLATSGASNVTLADFKLSGPGAGGAASVAGVLFANNSQNCKAERLEVTGTVFSGIWIQGSSFCEVRNCYLHGSIGGIGNGADIFVTNDTGGANLCDYNIIDGNECFGGVSSWFGVALQQFYTNQIAPRYCVVTNNRIGIHAAYGVLLYLVFSIVDCFNEVIGNYIENIQGAVLSGNAGAGIYLNGQGGAVIANNTIRNCCVLTTTNSLTPAGIGVNLGNSLTTTAVIGAAATSATLSAAWVSLSGTFIVQFSDGEQRLCTFVSGATSMTWTGGLVNAVTASIQIGLSPFTITGNKIENIQNFYGIEISGAAAGGVVSSNSISLQTGTPANGIFSNNSSNLSITGNVININPAVATTAGINIIAIAQNIYNITINGNTVIGCSNRGITSNNVTSGTVTNITVNGNTVSGGSATSVPIAINQCAIGVVSGNTLSTNSAFSFGCSVAAQLRVTGNNMFGGIAPAGACPGSYFDKTNYWQSSNIANATGYTLMLNAATGMVVESFGSVIPTTGTWAVGDRIEQVIPVVGNPKGWRCTVAGTPGTWVSEGNL